ncbi:glycosyltransferase family 2 protein [Agromyces sp. H66]|uniref:glycosyltransferase family 2 protein n=1 Tax=Agromyces sp. H66 TaxID=2529859 RepID=UPI0020C0061A|nr:glycosyltransferase family 2 protein [Agromyces sp. H66]
MHSETETPVLSVVIPTHNVRSWVRETLGSVLSQDIDHMEVIVVDDHSTDDTVAVVREVADADPRVRLIEATVRGGGSARNTGIEHARGRYLIFCDGDDLVPDGAYRALVESLEASGSDIAFGDYLKFSPNDTWRPTANWPAYQQARQRFSVAEAPSLLYGRACWNKAFRRSFWDSLDLVFPDVPRSNDIVPMTTAYLRAGTVDMVQEVVYLYRERQGTSSMTAKSDSATAFASYLEQELTCAELIAAAGSTTLARAYESLVHDRDGWVHLTKFLRSMSNIGSRDVEVIDALRRLLDRVERTRRVQPNAKRILFALTVDGSIQAAAALARITTGPRQPIGAELQDWITFLRAQSSAGREMLREEPWLARLVAEVLATAVLSGSAESDNDAVELALLASRQDPDVLHDAVELAPGVASDDPQLLARFEEARTVAPTIVKFSSGKSIEIFLETSRASPSLSPVLFEPRSGRIFDPDHLTRAEGRYVAAFRRRSLPAGLKLIVALREREGHRLHTARLRASLPDYSRFDHFTVIRRRDTLELARRRHWISRAARKAGRLLGQRLRPSPSSRAGRAARHIALRWPKATSAG